MSAGQPPIIGHTHHLLATHIFSAYILSANYVVSIARDDPGSTMILE